MNLKYLVGGAFAAMLFAVLLRALLPMPAFTTFLVLMLCLAAWAVKQKFGAGIATAWDPTKRFLRIVALTTLGVILFVYLYFFVAQVFRVYPGNAYEDWGRFGGFQRIFWGRAPHSIVYALIILATLAALIALAMWRPKGKLRSAAIFGLAAIVIVVFAGAILHEWSSTWPAKRRAIAEGLAEKGLVTYVEAAFKKPPLSEEYQGYDRRFCIEPPSPHDVLFADGENVVITLQTGCYHGPYTLPISWDYFEATHSNNPGDWASAWCAGALKPGDIHPAGQDFHGEFLRSSCPGKDGVAEFYLEGRGTAQFHAHTFK